MVDRATGRDAGGREGLGRVAQAAAIEVARLFRVALCDLYNPECIVVGGELAAAGPRLFAPLERAIRRYALAPAADAVRVVPSELGEYAEVRGAAGMVLAQAPRILADRLASAERDENGST